MNTRSKYQIDIKQFYESIFAARPTQISTSRRRFQGHISTLFQRSSKYVLYPSIRNLLKFYKQNRKHFLPSNRFEKLNIQSLFISRDFHSHKINFESCTNKSKTKHKPCTTTKPTPPNQNINHLSKFSAVPVPHQVFSKMIHSDFQNLFCTQLL